MTDLIAAAIQDALEQMEVDAITIVIVWEQKS